MSLHFDNLFIPVDFSINTKVAIAKALELSEGPGCNIHLFYVHKWSWHNLLFHYKYPVKYFIPTFESYDWYAKSMLEEWKNSIEQIRRDINVLTWMSQDVSIQNAIAKKAIKLKSTLIIIGKHSNHSWFPFMNTITPSELAENTGIAVLTVKAGAMHNEIKHIVVPVGMTVPERKLEMIEALRRKFRIHVHLVTYVNERNNLVESLAESLLTTFRCIKTNLACPVTYNVLSGTNKTKALLNYSINIGADIILVEPRSETKIGWMNKHLSDLIPGNSKTQVMAVQPS